MQETFSKSLLPDMIAESRCRFREGVVDFIKAAKGHDIPLLIFSGGVYDIIEIMLEQEGCLYDNITIIANKLKFDDDGIMIGCEPPFITASNKLEVCRNHPYFSSTKRSNILLLGDMISDLKMASCAEYSSLLTIGFCNTPETYLNEYLEKFDLVLKGNPGFDGVNKLLAHIFENPNKM